MSLVTYGDLFSVLSTSRPSTPKRRSQRDLTALALDSDSRLPSQR